MAHALTSSPLPSRLLVAMALLAAVGVHAQIVGKGELPTLLSCRVSDSLTAGISHDATGLPVSAGVHVTSGTHECDLQSQGAATVPTDGAVKFEWTDEIQGNTRYRATVKRVGTDGYSLALQPAGCGTIALPAAIALSAKDKSCKSRTDRDASFVLFWRQLRDAIAQRDGDMLQRLALPQLEFAEGPDVVKAPAAVMRNAAACMSDVPTMDGRTDLGKMLKATDTPRLDMPPLSRTGDSGVSAGDAFTAAWTNQGWRLQFFNASRSVFSNCKAR